MNNTTCEFPEFNCFRLANASTGDELGDELVFGRHEFMKTLPWVAVSTVSMLAIGCIMGTFGNVMILLAVTTQKCVQGIERIFIINLTLSDLFLTSIVDPLSIVAKLEGEHFFDRVPGLCRTIASMCTVSCVASMLTISSMSINRYVYICKHHMHAQIFTRRNSVLICALTYGVGAALILLNFAGVGNHAFDRKSLDCTLDRMETFTYTVLFAIVMIAIPSVLTGCCFLQILLHVYRHTSAMKSFRNNGQSGTGFITHRHTIQLAKTLFFIYMVFVLCWVPYAVLIVADTRDTFPNVIHVCVSVWAHMHPSMNWLIYYATNRMFATAFRRMWRATFTPRMKGAMSHELSSQREANSQSRFSNSHPSPLRETKGDIEHI